MKNLVHIYLTEGGLIIAGIKNGDLYDSNATRDLEKLRDEEIKEIMSVQNYVLSKAENFQSKKRKNFLDRVKIFYNISKKAPSTIDISNKQRFTYLGSFEYFC